MAIRLRQILKVDPIDIVAKTAVGVKLPFGLRRIFDLDYTTLDHAKSKLINLLLTTPGERINQPTFGVGLRNFLFEQQTEENQENLRARINSQVDIYIPEILVDNIKYRVEEHVLYLTVYYSYRANPDRGDSVELSFVSNSNN